MFSTIASTEGQIARVGVSKGDVFYYDYTVFLNGTDIYPYLLSQGNNTEWLKVEITQVSDSVINNNNIFRYKNGSEYSFSYTANVGALQTDEWIYPANLVVNDVVNDTLANRQYTVLETIARDYQGIQKEVNHIIVSAGSLYSDAYFEKTTGILQELYTMRQVNQNFSMASLYKIRQSSSIAENPSPSIPEFPPILMLQLVIIFTLLATISVKKGISHRGNTS